MCYTALHELFLCKKINTVMQFTTVQYVPLASFAFVIQALLLLIFLCDIDDKTFFLRLVMIIECGDFFFPLAISFVPSVQAAL